MVHYNFYSDHIEVVFDGDVILDSRSCGMQRILDELSHDLTISARYSKKGYSSAIFSSFMFIFGILLNARNINDDDLFSTLGNLFIVYRRCNFGHFNIRFISK